jgi:hypothetical protein
MRACVCNSRRQVGPITKFTWNEHVSGLDYWILGQIPLNEDEWVRFHDAEAHAFSLDRARASAAKCASNWLATDFGRHAVDPTVDLQAKCF